MSPPSRLVSSPTAAYRADMAGRDAPFGPNDDRWLSAANALHLAAAGRTPDAAAHLLDALSIAIDTLGEDHIDAFVEREWPGQRSYAESAAILAERAEDTGALHLAAVMLDDLLRAATDLTDLHRGRFLIMRARVERKLGHFDDATERYAYVASLAENIGSPELAVRAEIGTCAMAQVRGNIPALLEHSTHAAEMAERHGLKDLERLANQGLAMAYGLTGRINESAKAGLRVLELARGNAEFEAEALQLLGQTLSEAGHAALARVCYSAVLTKTTRDRMKIAALGGLAMSSGREGLEATVEWATKEIWRAQHEVMLTYELTGAFLECATGLRLLDREADAQRFIDAGLELARRAGHNEIIFRLESMREAPPRPAASALRPDSLDATIAARVVALGPEQLPSRVQFTAPA